MIRRRHLLSIATVSVASVLVMMPGCSTLTVEGDDSGAAEVDAYVAPAETGPAPGKDSGSEVKDATTKDATTKDSSSPVDAGIDTGPVAPAPGAACTTVGETFKRGCGTCGTQEAICEATKTVSAYGFCSGEVPNGCTPGATRQAACGFCGTRQEICQNNCAWAAGGCQNEVANGCTPGSTKTTTAGCVNQGEVKVLTCQNTCMFDAGGACGPIPTSTLAINQTVGQAASNTFSLSPTTEVLKNYDFGGFDYTDTCPLTLGSTKTSYLWVKLTNPTAKAATVSVWLSKAAGGNDLDTMMAWYNRSTPPPDDAARLTCNGYINDDCGGEDPCDPGNTLAPGLIDFTGVGDMDARPIIPANGAIVVYIGAFGANTTGNLVVNVRTDVLQ